MTVLALALALTLQADPPPHQQFMEEAEALGRVSYLGGICKGLGLVDSNAEGVVGLVDDFQRRAILAGTDGPLLDQTALAGTNREKRAVETMLDLGDDDGSERRRRQEDQAAQYIGNGCAGLTINYPSVFTWTGR